MNTLTKFEAVKKLMTIQYRKRTNAEYIEYLLEDKDGYVKSVSPNQFVHVNLPDETSEYASMKCYSLLVANVRAKESFGRFIDLVNKAKTLGIDWSNNPKDFYLKVVLA